GDLGPALLRALRAAGNRPGGARPAGIRGLAQAPASDRPAVSGCEQLVQVVVADLTARALQLARQRLRVDRAVDVAEDADRRRPRWRGRELRKRERERRIVGARIV